MWFPRYKWSWWATKTFVGITKNALNKIKYGINWNFLDTAPKNTLSRTENLIKWNEFHRHHEASALRRWHNDTYLYTRELFIFFSNFIGGDNWWWSRRRPRHHGDRWPAVTWHVNDQVVPAAQRRVRTPGRENDETRSCRPPPPPHGLGEVLYRCSFSQCSRGFMGHRHARPAGKSEAAQR